jgi:toxin ParE1/3/4
MTVKRYLNSYLILILASAKKTDQIIESKVENLLEQPLMGVQRDIFRGRILIIPEVSMIVSCWLDDETIRIMRVLHQKQKFPQD